MKIRKAKMIVACVELLCGKCDENLADPRTGSFIISLNDWPSDYIFTCHNCGTDNMMPKKATKP